MTRVITKKSRNNQRGRSLGTIFSQSLLIQLLTRTQLQIEDRIFQQQKILNLISLQFIRKRISMRQLRLILPTKWQVIIPLKLQMTDQKRESYQKKMLLRGRVKSFQIKIRKIQRMWASFKNCLQVTMRINQIRRPSRHRQSQKFFSIMVKSNLWNQSLRLIPKLMKMTASWV